MRAFLLPSGLILVLTTLLAMTKPDCEDSILKSRLTEGAFIAIFVVGAALSASLSENRRLLMPLLVGVFAIPLSAALWIMILWPVWRLGFLWDLYLMVLPTQLLWMIPTMVFTGWITKFIIRRKQGA